MVTTYTYAFDPTGVLPANKITAEQQILTVVSGKDYHYLIPTHAPFFAESMRIVYRDLEGIEHPLNEGIDYHYGFEFIGASRACAKAIYGSIVFLDLQLAGVVTLVYQTIGGQWALDVSSDLTLLSDTLRNPRVASWEQVVAVPTVFPPVSHEWNLTDMVGMSEVVGAVTEITAAVAASVNKVPQEMPYFYPTKNQVGLGNVDNFKTASDIEAKQAASPTRFMTSRGVGLAIREALVGFTPGTSTVGSGLPAAKLGDEVRFLRGDLTWAAIDPVTVGDTTSIREALVSEIRRALAAEQAEGDIRSRAIAAEVSARTLAISNEIVDRNNAIAVEVRARQDADSAEVTARNSAINTSVSAVITTLSQLISTEAQVRADAIATEVTDRNNAISSHLVNQGGSVDLETQARIEADAAEVIARNSAITSVIATEVTDRNSAISSAISTEVTARNSAISSGITAEVSARNSAITSAITSEVTARNSAISSAIGTEASSRTSAIASETANRNLALAEIRRTTAMGVSGTTLSGTIVVTKDIVGVITPIDTTTIAATVTLPTDAVLSDTYVFTDAKGTWSTNNVTFSVMLVHGQSRSVILDVDTKTVCFKWGGSVIGWIVY
jgi:hypothetical protein